VKRGGGANHAESPTTTLRVVPLPIRFADREDYGPPNFAFTGAACPVSFAPE
jgi:hypothetical protein